MNRSYDSLDNLLHFDNVLDIQIIDQVECQIWNKILKNIIGDDVIGIPTIANAELGKLFP